MKKRIALFACLAVLAYSCSDDTQLVKKDQGTRKEQVTSFISQLQKENLAKAEVENRVDKFMIDLGATRVTDDSQYSEFNYGLANGRVAECQGNATLYYWGNGSFTWVFVFSGCDSFCGGGDAVVVEDVQYEGEVRNSSGQSTICL